MRKAGPGWKPCSLVLISFALLAVLAAIALEHGATVCTTDPDLSRFPGLRWTNPLS
jgi:predicted nucleic acid-binding protein